MSDAQVWDGVAEPSESCPKLLGGSGYLVVVPGETCFGPFVTVDQLLQLGLRPLDGFSYLSHSELLACLRF